MATGTYLTTTLKYLFLFLKVCLKTYIKQTKSKIFVQNKILSFITTHNTDFYGVNYHSTFLQHR